ncbi:MAG: hypothetical protein EBU14_06175 [Acetobacteraceae bacterium]|nr:hypothetical protein [Acetobacteraceae bacterium]
MMRGVFGKRRLFGLAACLSILLLAPFALDRLFPPNLSRLHEVGVEVQDREGRILSILPARSNVAVARGAWAPRSA